MTLQSRCLSSWRRVFWRDSKACWACGSTTHQQCLTICSWLYKETITCISEKREAPNCLHYKQEDEERIGVVLIVESVESEVARWRERKIFIDQQYDEEDWKSNKEQKIEQAGKVVLKAISSYFKEASTKLKLFFVKAHVADQQNHQHNEEDTKEDRPAFIISEVCSSASEANNRCNHQ